MKVWHIYFPSSVSFFVKLYSFVLINHSCPSSKITEGISCFFTGNLSMVIICIIHKTHLFMDPHTYTNTHLAKKHKNMACSFIFANITVESRKVAKKNIKTVHVTQLSGKLQITIWMTVNCSTSWIGYINALQPSVFLLLQLAFLYSISINPPPAFQGERPSYLSDIK